MSDATNPAGTEARPQPSTFYRWAVLVIISLAMFGNYYIYDSINPVTDLMKAQLGFTDAVIGQLNTSYSIAAVLVLLVGGVLIDRLGTTRTTVLFGALCTVSGVTMLLSTEPWVMIGSRFLLGVGAEPLIVAITAALAKWFKGKELSFAFGINLTIARLGQVAVDWSPTWAKWAYDGWRTPLVLAAVLGSLCTLGALAYWALESRALKRYSLGEEGETDRLVVKDLFRFDASFWYCVALCVTFYSAIFPFRTFSIKFFIESYGLTREMAGQINSSLPVAAMVATPLFGLLVDRIGRRASLMFLGAFLLMPVYVIMAYHALPLWIPIAMMGVAFSLVPAIMWPSVAYIVEQKRLGTGLAVMTLVQQVGVAGLNTVVGYANDLGHAGPANPAGYVPGMWLFSGLGFVALLFAFLLWKVEKGPRAHGLETIRVGAKAEG
ncbi:MAG: MFS transporter [Acidobacteriota bacterium]